MKHRRIYLYNDVSIFSELSMTQEPYVDAAKAAEFLDIPVRYLSDLARAGRLPGHPLSMGAKRNVWRFHAIAAG
jgi:hypothetical protein